jgi:hypothetical protein
MIGEISAVLHGRNQVRMTQSRRDATICSPVRQCRETEKSEFRVPLGTAQTPRATSIPQFKSMSLQQQLQLRRGIYLVMVLLLVCVSSLRDSIHKPHPTRHCRAGLQAVQSLPGLISLFAYADAAFGRPPEADSPFSFPWVGHKPMTTRDDSVNAPAKIILPTRPLRC